MTTEGFDPKTYTMSILKGKKPFEKYLGTYTIPIIYSDYKIGDRVGKQSVVIGIEDGEKIKRLTVCCSVTSRVNRDGCERCSQKDSCPAKR